MINIQNITKFYVTESLKVPALQDVSLEINKGEFVLVIGPSGSGKSTLLHIIGCLDRPTSGRYFFEGMDVGRLSDNVLAEIRSQKIGFVFQFFNLFPHVTVLRNLELPMIFAGLGSKESRIKTAMKKLNEIGLPEKARFTPTQISGGEQQKVAIARALINDPALLLTDEPTGNLDSKSGEKIVALLKELNERGVTIILVTHDEKIARQTNRIVSLYDGKIVKDEVL
jgi:putative ABC transport system ATP-binding protein